MLLLDARICPMDAPDIPSGYVRVEGGKITALGPMDAAPRPRDGEEVVPLHGQAVLPGLIDVHCHVGLPVDELSDGSAPLLPQLRVLDGIDPRDAYFAQALRAGVTCCCVAPGSSDPIGGQICALKTRGHSVDEMLVRAPLAIKMALGENPANHWTKHGQLPGSCMDVAAMICGLLDRAVAYRAGEGSVPDPACEALLPLLDGSIPAHIHAHTATDIRLSLRIADEYGFRCVIVHGTEGPELAELLVRGKVDVICGPMVNTRTKAELQKLNMDYVGALREADVRVAVCTDHPEVPVDLLALSAALAAAHGLTRQQALAAVTIDAARIAGLDDRLGSISPGKDADLLVYAGDPLAVGGRPDRVMLDGKWVYS